MTMNSVDSAIDGLALNDPICLPFQPQALKFQLQEIPRFLFRIYDDDSTGENSPRWMNSINAQLRIDNYDQDVFSSEDHARVANQLNNHLRWKADSGSRFKSWTSSLLFALQYAKFRHYQSGTDYENIYLCVIDTSQFPKNSFMCDLDLIQFYSPYSAPLTTFQALRREGHHRVYAGSYYFAEYLSQGSLHVHRRSNVVSMQKLIDHDLFKLRSELATPSLDPKPALANEVLRLREAFYDQSGTFPEASPDECRAVSAIASLFEERFQIFIAANLFALRPRRTVDDRILEVLRLPPLNDSRMNFCPADIRMVPHDTLPEVTHAASIVISVHWDMRMQKARLIAEKAESTLVDVMLALLSFPFAQNMKDAENSSWMREDKAKLLNSLKVMELQTKLLIQSVENKQNVLVDCLLGQGLRLERQEGGSSLSRGLSEKDRDLRHSSKCITSASSGSMARQISNGMR